MKKISKMIKGNCKKFENHLIKNIVHECRTQETCLIRHWFGLNGSVLACESEYEGACAGCARALGYCRKSISDHRGIRLVELAYGCEKYGRFGFRKIGKMFFLALHRINYHDHPEVRIPNSLNVACEAVAQKIAMRKRWEREEAYKRHMELRLSYLELPETRR